MWHLGKVHLAGPISICDKVRKQLFVQQAIIGNYLASNLLQSYD